MSTPAVVRTPDERFADLPDWPFAPRYTDVELPGLDGRIRLARVDEGGRNGDPVVLLHGEPTWAYLYRHVITALAAAGHRVVAPDLPGFGRSDKPTDRDWFTYHHLAAALDTHLAVLDLDAPMTLVVHDWGGLLGLPWAVAHPEQVGRLVITDTALFAPGGRPTDAWLAFRDYVARQDILPAGFLVQGATSTQLPAAVLDAYEAPLHEPAAHAGALAMPAIVPLSEDDPGAAEEWAANQALTRWQAPTLIVWGGDDVILPAKIGERWAATIPGCVGMDVLAGAHHFVQEDAGAALADRILAFMSQTTVDRR